MIVKSNCRNGFFHLKRFSPLPVCTEDVECTDCTSGYGRKMLNLLFAVVHRGQLLFSSSEFSRLTSRGFDGLTEGEGVVTLPFYRLLLLNRR
jgi:hypothetical protein